MNYLDTLLSSLVVLMVLEACVESWFRVSSENERSFLLYKIVLKDTETRKSWQINCRYSEFYVLHGEVTKFIERERGAAIGIDQYVSLLNETFPSKQVFSLQTNLFADRRARALDSYIQILMVLLNGKCGLSTDFENCLKTFFRVPLHETPTAKDSPTTHSNNLRTPCVVLSKEIEALRAVSFENLNFERDLRALQDQIVQLQDKRTPSLEEAKCVKAFYEIKREWEISRIRTGKEGFKESFTIDEGSLGISSSITVMKRTTTEGAPSDVPLDTHVNNTNTTTKTLLRGQEAILADLTSTLQEQKKLSKEIYQEITEQNRIIGQLDRQQETTREGFKGSTDRVKKLQK